MRQNPGISFIPVEFHPSTTDVLANMFTIKIADNAKNKNDKAFCVLFLFVE
jgi:hypothetical protein